ncbi:MAG: hypothetical protein PHI19_03525 [Clostridia bacterium]|nr:hypothetical protein [Clostridia bacterium]
MKKKIRTALLVIGIFIVLFFPFHIATYKDGGTKVYGALTYKVVAWNKLVSDEDGPHRHSNTCVYWFPDSLKGIDELWDIKH